MLDINEIMKMIPHRSPFLLIDRILELEPGVRAVGRKCVTYNEPFFTGHFPNEPIMPGVLILEAMAQVGSVVCLSVEKYKDKNAYLGSINKARFRNKVVPGDVLTIELIVTKTKGNISIAKAKAYDEEKVFVEAEFMVAIN